MVRVGGASELTSTSQRQGLLAALVEEERATRPRVVEDWMERDDRLAVVGKPVLRVADANAEGKASYRHDTDADTNYALRCILQGEVVADVGDHTTWPGAVLATHAIWDILNLWNIGYWGALSGGVGLHTHIFIRPASKEARAAFGTALQEAARIFLDTPDAWIENLVEADKVCINPAWRSRLIREFGAAKTVKGVTHRKTLWTTGPGPYRSLPLDREAAYKQAGLGIPTKLPRIAEQPPGAGWLTIREAFGACPRSLSCYPAVGDTGLDGLCAACPAAS